MGLMVSKSIILDGVLVSTPDGDVLVTLLGNQLQNSKVKLKFWPPQQQTISEGSLVQNNYPHNNCQCLSIPVAIRMKEHVPVIHLQLDLKQRRLSPNLDQS